MRAQGLPFSSSPITFHALPSWETLFLVKCNTQGHQQLYDLRSVGGRELSSPQTASITCISWRRLQAADKQGPEQQEHATRATAAEQKTRVGVQCGQGCRGPSAGGSRESGSRIPVASREGRSMGLLLRCMRAGPPAKQSAAGAPSLRREEPRSPAGPAARPPSAGGGLGRRPSSSSTQRGALVAG